jgi:MFS family permease
MPTPPPSSGSSPLPGAHGTAPSALETPTYRKVAWRILPILMVSYLVAYLDRVNIGFARLQMMSDLKFSETVYGFGAGVFFIGYVMFQVPSNLMLRRIGARVWIGCILVTWGVVSGTFMFLRTPAMFYALRFLLGVAESGFYPGVILYLTFWYPSSWRARMTSLFMVAIPVSGLIGGPISGWIMQSFSGTHGLAGWQWLFLVEACPAIVLGIFVFFYLDDDISAAAWLTSDEKAILEQNLADDTPPPLHDSLVAVFADRRIWLMCVTYFSCAMGQYGLTFWMPALIQASGVTHVFTIGLLTAIPYAAAVVAMLLFGQSADKHRERRWHMATALLLGAAGLTVSAVAGTHTVIAMVALTAAACGVLPASPLFWNLPTAFLGGARAAAGIAAINSIANLGGFVSPYVVGGLRDLTHSTGAGLFAVSAVLVAGALATLRIPAQLVNR